MADTTSNVLLRPDLGPSTRVRVRPGFVLRAFDDMAPSVPVTFGPGDELDLDADEAVYGVAIGAVEAIV